jgi:hypothetical protein
VYPICVPLCNQLADPTYRAKQIAGTQRPPRSRQRKAEARNSRGAKPSALADARSRLETKAPVERVVVPDTDEAIANEDLREAFKLTIGARETPDINLLGWLPTYTKPRPPTVLGGRAFQPGRREVEDLLGGPIGFPAGRGTKPTPPSH